MEKNKEGMRMNLPIVVSVCEFRTKKKERIEVKIKILNSICISHDEKSRISDFETYNECVVN
jgi:hypothetical protein